MNKKLAVFLLAALVFGGLNLPFKAGATSFSAGDLIKASQAAVYYYASDGGRYTFPNEKTYFTWYTDFSSVKTITDAELAAISLKGNVTYKPGVRMIKIQTDPKVYAVDTGGTLRWVGSETVADALYGFKWNTVVDDVSDAFFINYKTGTDITKVSDFDKIKAISGAESIDVDKGLKAASNNTPPAAAPETPVLSGPQTVKAGTEFSLSWNSPSGAINYIVQWSSDESFASSDVLYSGPGLNIKDNIQESRYYRVKSENETGASGWSAVAKVSVGSCNAPDVPKLTATVATIDSGKAFALNWTAITGVKSYKVERATDVSFYNPTDVSPTYLSSTISQTLTVSVDTAHLYRVRATNSCGTGAWSNAVVVNVTAPTAVAPAPTCSVPSAPTLTASASSVSSGTAFSLSWASVSGAISYKVERAINSSFSSPTDISPSSLSTSISQTLTASADTTYYYRARATNSCGNGAWSSTAQVKITAAASTVKTYNVPGDYSTIQAAINAAPDNETILVSDGTYEENITVNKLLSLKSVNGYSKTIIKAKTSTKPAILITASSVSITGFDIKGSNGTGGAGIKISGGAGKAEIKNNYIESNINGIHLASSNGNNIHDNTFYANKVTSKGNPIGEVEGLQDASNGIYLYASDQSSIYDNKFYSNSIGVILSYGSDDNNISTNIFSKNVLVGIAIDDSDNSFVFSNLIKSNYTTGSTVSTVGIAISGGATGSSITINSIESNETGIFVYQTSGTNYIYINNLINNGKNGYSGYSGGATWNSSGKIDYTYGGNGYSNYRGNYWSGCTFTDANKDGIGDSACTFTNGKDSYPLPKQTLADVPTDN